MRWFSSLRKIKYSRRSDTTPDHALAAEYTDHTGQRRRPTSGTPQPSVCHVMEQYRNNSIESDHGRLKSRLRPMRGLKRLRSARMISAGHAFVQNIRRGHYELSVEFRPQHRLSAAFTELALAMTGRHPAQPYPPRVNATMPFS